MEQFGKEDPKPAAKNDTKPAAGGKKAAPEKQVKNDSKAALIAKDALESDNNAAKNATAPKSIA